MLKKIWQICQKHQIFGEIFRDLLKFSKIRTNGVNIKMYFF